MQIELLILTVFFSFEAAQVGTPCQLLVTYNLDLVLWTRTPWFAFCIIGDQENGTF